MTQPREALQRPLSQLERYAGWLSRDHVSVAVCANIQALGAAMDVGDDTSLLLLTLDKDIGRLPGGDMRKMLRKALGEILYGARVWRDRREPSGTLMTALWIVIGLGIAGAIAGMALWRRSHRRPDLGAVSHQWIAEHRPGPHDSRH